MIIIIIKEETMEIIKINKRIIIIIRTMNLYNMRYKNKTINHRYPPIMKKFMK